jgi:hypothetical protein
MSEDIRKMIDKVKNFKQFVNEQKLNENYTNTNIKIGDVYSESDVYPYIQKLHRNEDDFYDGDIGERIERFPQYQVAEIFVDKINMDEYELDDDYFNDYVEKYKQIGTYPPIVLGYYDNRWGYDIIDGTHRANALKNAGLKSIVCFVGLNEHQKRVS